MRATLQKNNPSFEGLFLLIFNVEMDAPAGFCRAVIITESVDFGVKIARVIAIQRNADRKDPGATGHSLGRQEINGGSLVVQFAGLSHVDAFHGFDLPSLFSVYIITHSGKKVNRGTM